MRWGGAALPQCSPNGASPARYLLQAEVRGQHGGQVQEAVPGPAQHDRRRGDSGAPSAGVAAAPHAGGRLGRAEPGPAAAARRPALAPNCPLGAAGPSRDSFSSPLPPPGQWYDPLPTNAVAASTRSRPLIGRSIGGRGSFCLASRRRPLPLLEQPIREGWRAARRPIGCLLGERLETPAKGAAAAGKMAAGGGGALGEACRHHQQLGACGSRAKYREGRRPRAVKVRSEGGLAAPCGDGLRKRSEPWRSVSSR